MTETTDDERRYRVACLNTRTGKTGHGNPTTRAVAESWVKHCNAKYPFIEYWVEEVPKEQGQ